MGKAHRRKGRGRPRPTSNSADLQRMPIAMLVDATIRSSFDPRGAPHRPDPQLVAAMAARPQPAIEALAGTALAAVATAWERNWQPADLVRAASRTCGQEHAGLLAAAVLRQLSSYDPSSLPPRWQAQLDAFDTRAVGQVLDGDASNNAWLAYPGQVSMEARLRVATEAIGFLRYLPELPRVGPRPGEPNAAGTGHRHASTASSSVDPGVLHRVMSLLAKAESTTFAEEAEALTGKAQQLMARHALDRALVEAARAGDRSSPVATARRVAVDDPYASARAMLLQGIAAANRCRSVWTKNFGFATVFGDEADLDTVEMLYTSLLVQSARAMLAASPPGERSAGATRSFRQSFLVAFATRISDRLAEAVAQAVDDSAAEVETLLPVLASREDAADRARDEAYPQLRSARTAANNAAGWQAGRSAADRAELDLQDGIRSRDDKILGLGQ